MLYIIQLYSLYIIQLYTTTLWAEWGRRWCAVAECAEVAGWKNDVKQFEINLAAMRGEAEEYY